MNFFLDMIPPIVRVKEKLKTFANNRGMKEEVDLYHEVQGDLPKDIEHCFMVGVAGMKQCNTHIWVAKDFRESVGVEC